MTAADKVYPISYVHYVHRHPHHSSSISKDTDPNFLSALLERSRAQRDTYDERQKLVSTYKIISKTQCLLQMRPSDGHVDAKLITNLDDSKETKDGIFLFLPIAVNLFLIQHKESKRYLCGENSQLFGLVDRNEQQCVFETKRSDIDFGRWDSYRLFYETSNRGYLSISHTCHTRLRRKFENDNYLNFLAFVRINTDLSPEAAAARRIVNQQKFPNQQQINSYDRTNDHPPKLISDYRQRFRYPKLSSLIVTTTTTITTLSTTTTSSTTTTTTITTAVASISSRPFRRFNHHLMSVTEPSLFVRVNSLPQTVTRGITPMRWRTRSTRRF